MTLTFEPMKSSEIETFGRLHISSQMQTKPRVIDDVLHLMTLTVALEQAFLLYEALWHFRKAFAAHVICTDMQICHFWSGVAEAIHVQCSMKLSS